MSRGVCILTETYWPVVGGGETQARLLAAGLAGRGLRVTVVTRRSDRSLPKREQVDGIEVLRLPPAGRRHLNKWGLAVPALWALRRLRPRYDAVVVSGFRILGAPALGSGKPCVMKADSLGELSGAFFEPGLRKLGLKPTFPPYRLALGLRNRLLRRANAFVAISSAIRDELVAGGVPAGAVHSIPNGVDTTRFHPLPASERPEQRRRLGLDPAAAMAVYTGRLVSYKGLPTLLRAWRDLAADRPATLVLVGSGGLDIHDCEAELRAYVDEHGLGDRVIFTGAVDDVLPYLQAADVYAFPTENEAFGISLVEAMACGLPAVATPVGGVRDILRDGRTGLEVPTGDAPALAAALRRLLDDRERAAAMGREAREVAEREFSATRVVDRYVDLIGGLTGA